MAIPAPHPLRSGETSLTLDEADARRVWNWILTRQGLADSSRLPGAWHVADAVLGLHAARLPSPFAIVAARTSCATAPASLYTTPVRASLMTVRCMRKTLHTLPLHLGAAAHAATLKFRERDARRAVLNGGYTVTAAEQVAGRLANLLQDGPLPHRHIEERLAGPGTSVQLVRLAIKVAWERGTIAYLNTASTWNRQAKTFALTSAAYPAANLSISRDEAIVELVTAYFERYGPAAIRDATWWSGLPASDITTALRACGRPVTPVITPWSSEPCLMFTDQVTGSLDNDSATGVQFLAHEDSALKAYFHTRNRYLAGVPPSQAFNQIGEALPCVIIDGTVAGTWAWNPRFAAVDVTLIPGRTRPGARRLVRARAAELTGILRTAWAPPTQRPASPIPPSGSWPAASVTTPASPSPAAR